MSKRDLCWPACKIGSMTDPSNKKQKQIIRSAAYVLCSHASRRFAFWLLTLASVLIAHVAAAQNLEIADKRSRIQPQESADPEQPDSAAAQKLEDQAQPQFPRTVRRLFGEASDTTADAALYLQEMAFGRGDEKLLQKLVDQLGSSNYRERELAEQQLALKPFLDLQLMNSATELQPEVRWRLQQLRKQRQAHEVQLLQAAMADVRLARPTGLLPALRKILAASDSASISKSLVLTMGELARDTDGQLLESYLKDELPEVRRMACAAVSRLLPERAVALCQPLLQDPEPLVCIDACWALLDLKSREPLLVLIELAGNQNKSIGNKAWRVLDAVLERELGILAAADADRQAQLDEARAWLVAESDQATLRIPIDVASITSSILAGNTLIAVNGGDIYELDSDHNEVLKFRCEGASGAAKTSDGTYIVHSFGNRFLKEVDATGKELWSITDLGFNNARLTPAGTVLVTIGEGKFVREYSRVDQSVVWEVTLDSWTNDAYRLDNGNTLVAQHSGIHEIDSGGETVWSFTSDALGTYVSATPLANGNRLVGGSDGVVMEVDSSGDIVWQMDDLGYIHDACQDENGHTWVLVPKKLREFDSDRQQVWEMETGDEFGTVAR